MILIFLLYMLFASGFTIGKAVLDYSDPIFCVSVRMLIAGVLLLGYQYFFNYKKWKFSFKDVWLFVPIVLLHIYFAYILEFWALQYVPSFKTCFLFNLSPFITALFSYFLFAERLSKKQWIGLCIGFLGFIPTLITYLPTEDILGAHFPLSLPEIALILAVASSAYGWIVMKKLVDNKEYSPIMVNGIGMLLGGALALITSFIFEGMPHLKMPAESLHSANLLPPQWEPIVMFLLYIVLLILIINIICYNLYGTLLKKYSATFLSFAGFTTPLFAALFGWAFIGETISWDFFLSVGIVFLGLYLFCQEDLGQKYR